MKFYTAAPDLQEAFTHNKSVFDIFEVSEKEFIAKPTWHFIQLYNDYIKPKKQEYKETLRRIAKDYQKTNQAIADRADDLLSVIHIKELKK